MELSIIIPAHNEEEYIGRCLGSLTEEIHNQKDSLVRLKEVVVVNNASTDKTEHIAKKFPKVKVVFEEKKGITQARQKGLKEAKGDLLAYIDADTYISSGWFETINDEFRNDGKLICLSGPYDYFDIPVWQRRAVILYWSMLAAPTDILTGYVVVGGNFVARKDALIKIGGFDTTISFYGEDTNIGRRLSEVGKVKFSKKFVIHTSARRLNQEGILKVGSKYMINYLWEVIFHKPFSKSYSDVR